MAISYNNCNLLLENEKTALSVLIEDSVPYVQYLENKTSGYRWENAETLPMAAIPGFDFAGADVAFTEMTDDRDHMSAQAKLYTLTFEKSGQKVTVTLRMYDDNPFVTMGLTLVGTFGGETAAETMLPDGSERRRPLPDAWNESLLSLPISDWHLILKAAEFHDATDRCDAPVTEYETNVYHYTSNQYRGHFFRLNSYLKGETLTLVKEAPCRVGRLVDSENDINVSPKHYVQIGGSGYDFTAAHEFTGDETPYKVSFAATAEADALRAWRDFYRYDCETILKDGLYIMSNTWGDRSCDMAVCESFMLKEVECAQRLGVTVIQVDDGWQTGVSANSKLDKRTAWENGLYRSVPNFWEINRAKFPNDLFPVVERAKKAGIRMGLWFSPDLVNDYENYERDAETLVGLYRAYGADFFKIDSVMIKSETINKRLLEMLRIVNRETDGKLVLNFDITNGRRWGYFPHRQYGSLFLENRYTDNDSYYPHSTLRNLWRLSPYIPAARLQMEFLNPRRNANVYGDDPLRPNLYEMDYIFAAVMFSNPLCWMEMSHLSEKDTECLAGITKLWNNYREEFGHADVTPIGECPDGLTFTGFLATSEKKQYLLLFRENGEESTYDFRVDVRDGDWNVLYASGGAAAERNGSTVHFTAPEKRSFLLVSIG